MLLPVGISFYTFQSLSYTFDVYRGVQTPERHFGRFAVFVAFFPQLIAGPIERSGALLPQLEAPGRVRMGDLRGMPVDAVGALKIVIADHAGVVVSTVYDQPAALYPAGVVGFAVVLFAVQLYTDFSGYCDIAVGVARLMGIRLSTNFRRPFFARSVADYWRRRHITLGRWFADYVYFPLGGSRQDSSRQRSMSRRSSCSAVCGMAPRGPSCFGVGLTRLRSSRARPRRTSIRCIKAFTVPSDGAV